MSRKTREQTEGDVAVAEKTKTKRPPMYKVLLHNDDYTPMEFVIAILETVFHKDHTEAVSLMYTVHFTGKAVAGLYPRSIAESKVAKVLTLAREKGHPLLCTMEPDA